MEINSESVESVLIAWEPGEGSGDIELIVSSSETSVLLSELADSGVAAGVKNLTSRTSGSALLDVVVATAQNPAAWAAIGLALKAFLDRNKGKKLQIGLDDQLAAEDYSAKDIERILRALAEDPDLRDSDR
ncbi:hypothetical protein [Nocardia salmonicida]|uniref:hypothetical protein n=1 Tax=Nocardia salmonicida TaxID=53431 RepID=UPI00340FAB69